MNSSGSFGVLKSIATALAVVALVLVPLSGPVLADDDDHGHDHGHDGKVLKFDVAEIGQRFVPDDGPLAGGLPAYGNSFLTQGLIYPFGFLDGQEGVDADGNPTAPDQVLGTWTCFGWHVQDFATALTGPTVVTTQIYEFKDKPGRKSLVTEGFELADFNVWIKRPITGGTGPFATARGEAKQKLLAFPNPSGGVNLRFRVKVQ